MNVQASTEFMGKLTNEFPVYDCGLINEMFVV